MSAINLKSIVDSPLFPVALTILGTLFGIMLKGVLDFLTNEANRRKDLEQHIMKQIEETASTYYLMSNNSYLLSDSLNQFIEAKRELQALPVDPVSSLQYREWLSGKARDTGKDALFFAGKLYRVIVDHFWIKGGRYFLPDKWANKAIEDLHNNLMMRLRIDSDILLKYIEADTEERVFREKLEDSEKENEFSDLQDAYVRYSEWLSKQDKEVREAAAYAQAYSNLFSQQMERLYKDWFTQGVLRRKSPSDPRRAGEVKDRKLAVLRRSSPLSEETRALIKRAAERNEKEQRRQDNWIMKDITATADVVEANAHLNLGWNYYMAQKYDLAIREYLTARDKQPQNALIYNNLGNVYTSQANYQEAINSYERAVRLEPNDAVFHANFGQMRYRRAEYDEAIQCYSRALEHDASNVDYHNELGNAYFNRWNPGDADAAAREYRHAIALDPLDPILYSNLAGTYAKLESYEEAIGSYEKAIESATDTSEKAQYYEEIGRIYEDKLEEREDSAIAAYRQAQELDSDRDYSLIHYQLGVTYSDAADYERAVYEFDKAIRLCQEREQFQTTDSRKAARYYNALGLAYRRLGRSNMAVSAYEKALELDSEGAYVYLNLGLAYHKTGRYDEALEPLRKYLEVQPNNIDALLALSESYAYGSQPDAQKAIETCQRARSADPDGYSPYLVLGTLLLHSRDYAEAADALEESYNRNPDQGMLEELISAYTGAVDEEPDSAETLFKLARAHARAGNYHEALIVCKKALDLVGDNPVYRTLLHVMQGRLHYEEQEWEQAIDQWTQALEIAPAGALNLPSMYKNLGIAYDGLGQVERALHYYEQATVKEPNDFALRYELGLIHFEHNRVTEAVSEFQEACRQLSNNGYILARYAESRYVDTIYNIGYCYYQMQYTDLAKEEWQEAITLDPNFGEALYNLGVLSYSQGDKESASSYWKQASTISPPFEPARQVLESIAQHRAPALNLWGDIRGSSPT